jgi:hypothetical protein
LAAIHLISPKNENTHKSGCFQTCKIIQAGCYDLHTTGTSAKALVLTCSKDPQEPVSTLHNWL